MEIQLFEVLIIRIYLGFVVWNLFFPVYPGYDMLKF